MKFLSLASLALAGALPAAVHALPQSNNNDNSDSSSSTACNNSPLLCDRGYNNVTYLGGHNSAFLRDESTNDSLSGNQYYNATKALSAGLRLLQAQVHQGNDSSSLNLCHSSCELLDAGPLEDWLASVKSWMDDNPNDVVTILLVNYNTAPVADFARAFDGSGIAEYGLSAPNGSWPTLQKMIDDNDRMVSFVTGIEASESAPYLLNEFDYVFETAFEVTEIGGFNCTLDRPQSAQSARNAISNGMLSLVNHFKYSSLSTSIQLPDMDTIEVVNDPGTGEVGNLGRHIEECDTEWRQAPNFALIDFFTESNPMEAVDRMNGLSSDDISGRSDPEDDSSSAAPGGARSFGYVALVAFFSAAVLLI